MRSKDNAKTHKSWDPQGRCVALINADSGKSPSPSRECEKRAKLLTPSQDATAPYKPKAQPEYQDYTKLKLGSARGGGRSCNKRVILVARAFPPHLNNGGFCWLCRRHRDLQSLCQHIVPTQLYLCVHRSTSASTAAFLYTTSAASIRQEMRIAEPIECNRP